MAYFLTKGHIARIWVELTRIYGSFFVSKFGETDSGAWYDVLKDLTPKALDKGLEKIKTLQAGEQFIDFPPNAVQFRAICLSFYDSLGLPHVNQVFDELINVREGGLPLNLHPAIHYTASKLDEQFFKLAEQSVGGAINYLKTIYEPVCHLLRQGYQLPKIEKPLIRPARIKNKELADARSAEIRKLIQRSIKKE